MIPLSLVLLMSLSLFGCSLLADNKKVFNGESKHWKARFEITKKPDADGTNGGFQLEFLGDKFSKGEYKLTFSNALHEGSGTADFHGKEVKGRQPFSGSARSNYDYEDVLNSIITVVIKWDDYEEKIQLKLTNN